MSSVHNTPTPKGELFRLKKCAKTTKMLNSEQNPEGCDATDGDSSNAAGNKNSFLLLGAKIS